MVGYSLDESFLRQRVKDQQRRVTERDLKLVLHRVGGAPAGERVLGSEVLEPPLSHWSLATLQVGADPVKAMERRGGLTRLGFVVGPDLRAAGGVAVDLPRRPAGVGSGAAEERLRLQRLPRAEDAADLDPDVRRDAAGGDRRHGGRPAALPRRDHPRVRAAGAPDRQRARLLAGRAGHAALRRCSAEDLQRDDPGGRRDLPPARRGRADRRSTSSRARQERCRGSIGGPGGRGAVDAQPAQQRRQVLAADGPRSTSRCATWATRCGVVVEDHGIGIPPAEQKRIFDDFYRAPGARTASAWRGPGSAWRWCGGT